MLRTDLTLIPNWGFNNSSACWMCSCSLRQRSRKKDRQGQGQEAHIWMCDAGERVAIPKRRPLQRWCSHGGRRRQGAHRISPPREWMCDYEVISHEPVRLRGGAPPHGSSGCHWLVTMCLCLIDCEMVCCCAAVWHLRPTEVIDWFGHVECSHLVRSNAFFSSFVNKKRWQENSWARNKAKAKRKHFPLSTSPFLSSYPVRKKNWMGRAVAPDYPGRG